MKYIVLLRGVNIIGAIIKEYFNLDLPIYVTTEIKNKITIRTANTMKKY